MKHILKELESIRKYLADRPAYILLDFDGTLSPIVDTPDKALLSPATKQVLTALSRRRGITVCIISGRTLMDIKQRVGISGIWYAGVHGYEWEIDGKIGKAPSGKKDIFLEIKPKLATLRTQYPETFLEDKGISLAFHYRLLPDETMVEFANAFNKVLSPYRDQKNITVKTGKKVYEIFPDEGWNKGQFVKYLMSSGGRDPKNTAFIYIGDDTTDEDVFRMLPEGITVKVGEGKSAARYFLRDDREVAILLSWIASVYP